MSNIKKLSLDTGTFTVDTVDNDSIKFNTTNNKDFKFIGGNIIASEFLIDNGGVYQSINSYMGLPYINVNTLSNTITTSLSSTGVPISIKGAFSSSENNGFSLTTNNLNEFSITYTGSQSCICMYNLATAYEPNVQNNKCKILFKVNSSVVGSTSFIFEGISQSINNLNTCGVIQLDTNDTLDIFIESIDYTDTVLFHDFNLNMHVLNLI